MKIHQLVRDFNIDSWGGIEQVVLNYNRLLKEKGHINTISAWDICKNKKNIYKEWGMDVSQIYAMPPHLNNYDMDLFHWHSMYPGLCWVAPYLKRKKIPIIMSLHCPSTAREIDLYFKGKSSRFWSMRKLGRMWMVPRLRSLLPQVKAFICHSKEHVDLMNEYFPDHQVTYIPNGVDAKRFSQGDGSAFRKKYNIPEDAFVVLNMARIDPCKNQNILIKTLPKMLEIQPNTHLVLIGAPEFPEFYKELKQMVLNLGVEKFVTIIPGLFSQDQMLVNAYHSCNIFMLPSQHEIFPLVLLEACSSGKNIIASKVGHIPLVIEDGITGLLHDVNDTIGMLFCFKKIIADKENRMGLGEKARTNIINKYDWNIIGNQLIDLYKSVIESKIL